MLNLFVTLPQNFDELLAEYRLKVLGTKEPTRGGALAYDKNAALLSLGNRNIQIPIGSNQAMLCEALFDLPFGQWLKSADVKHDFFKDSESGFYNAVRAINATVYKEFGIDELLQYKGHRARIKTEILTQKQ